MRSKSFFLFSVLLILLELIIFREFIFGDYYFIFKDLGVDSYAQEYPFITKNFELIRSGNWHSYSFSNGLGENVYPFSLDPILFLLAKFTSVSAMQSMLVMMLVYVFLAGIFMFSFLRNERLHIFACFIGGFAYAFSAYLLASGAWMVTEFSMLGFHFVFLLFALKKSLQERKYYLLTITFALMGINSPVTLYFGGLITLIFVIFQNYLNTDFKIFNKKNIPIGIFILLGFGISSLMWLPFLEVIKLSPRGSGFVENISLSDVQNFNGSTNSFSTGVLRLFSPNFAGNILQYRGFANYLESSMLYCGIASFILFFQAFSFGNKKHKIVIILGSVFILITLFSAQFRLIVNAFTGDYFRNLNLLGVLFILIVACSALSKILVEKRIYKKMFAVSLSIFVVIVASNYNVLDRNSLFAVSFFIISFSALLFFIKKISLKNFSVAFSVLFFIELLTINSKVISDREICTKQEINFGGYEDASKKEIAKINSKDKTFFRLEKDFVSHLGKYLNYENAVMQNYRSSMLYNSFNNVNYIKFLDYFGQIKQHREIDTRWTLGVRQEPLLMNLTSTKYFLKSEKQNIPNFYTLLADKGDFSVLKNNNYLPFGFCYDFKNCSDKTLPLNEKLDLAYDAVAISKEDEGNFKEIPNFVNNKEKSISLSEKIQNLRKDTLKISDFTEGKILAKINVNKPKILFLSIPFDKGWEILDNDKSVSFYKAFDGLICLPLSKGNHNLEMTYSPPLRTLGIWISLISLLMFFGVFLYFSRNKKIDE